MTAPAHTQPSSPSINQQPSVVLTPLFSSPLSFSRVGHQRREEKRREQRSLPRIASPYPVLPHGLNSTQLVLLSSCDLHSTPRHSSLFDATRYRTRLATHSLHGAAHSTTSSLYSNRHAEYSRSNPNTTTSYHGVCHPFHSHFHIEFPSKSALLSHVSSPLNSNQLSYCSLFVFHPQLAMDLYLSTTHSILSASSGLASAHLYMHLLYTPMLSLHLITPPSPPSESA